MPIDPVTGIYSDPLGPGNAGSGPVAALGILSDMLASNTAATHRQGEEYRVAEQGADLDRKLKDQQDEDAYLAEVNAPGFSGSADDYTRAGMRHGNPEKAITGGASLVRSAELKAAADERATVAANNAALADTTRNRTLFLKAFNSKFDDGLNIDDSLTFAKGVVGKGWSPDMDSFADMQVRNNPEYVGRDRARKDRSAYMKQMANNAAQRTQDMRAKQAAVRAGKATVGPKFRKEMSVQQKLVALDRDIQGMSEGLDKIMAGDPTKKTLEANLDEAINRHKMLSAKLKEIQDLPDDEKPVQPGSVTPTGAAVKTQTAAPAAFIWDPKKNMAVPNPALASQ